MAAKAITGPVLNYVPTSTVGQFFFESAHKYQHKTCHVDAHTNREETFSGIKQRSTRLALSMLKLGVTPQDVVVTCSSVDLDAPVPILAAFYVGAKVANLDTSLSARQISHLLSLVCPRMVFVNESCVGLIEESLTMASLQAEVVVMGSSSKYSTMSDLIVVQTEEGQFEPVAVDLDDTAIIFFSSGTTGLPKAICHSHISFIHFVYAFFNSGGRFDTVLTLNSFYWIMGMIYLSCSFAAGARRVVCGGQWTPEDLFSCIDRYKITYMYLAPIQISQLLTYTDHHKYDTSSLHSLFVSGTPASASLVQKFVDVFPNSHFILGYGQTEIGVATMLNVDSDQHLIKKKFGSSGKPICGLSLIIVDTATNEVLGPNQQGEIRLKSPSAMKGYYKADGSNVFDEDGFLQTGDVGYYDEDHCLYVVERLKEMFKYLCWHIVPASIEAVLLEHPDVKEAAVFGLPRGEEVGEVPTACVVLKNGATGEEEIAEFVASRVSDREKLRGGVYVVDGLMRTPTGKLMRKEIKNSIIEMLALRR